MQGFTPSGWQKLCDPSIRTVLMVGCGGGFDFVHSLILYDSLVKLGKTIIVGSYSFGNPLEIRGESMKEFEYECVSKGPRVFLVDSSCEGNPAYCPEIGFCCFLDQKYPGKAPHSIYAYYARAFSVPTLKGLYEALVDLHNVDAIIAVDGGSDSLMRGDEEGLGDPIEDAVTVAAISAICSPSITMSSPAPMGILAVIGFGCDRFNGVSDAASLRAVAELTKLGGFMGCIAIEPGSSALKCYQEGVACINANESFRSIISGSILASALGHFGSPNMTDLKGTVEFDARITHDSSSLFLMPLMSFLWFFDVITVSNRSLVCQAIRTCDTHRACAEEVSLLRLRGEMMKGRSRDTENVTAPAHLVETETGKRTEGWLVREMEHLPRVPSFHDHHASSSLNDDLNAIPPTPHAPLKISQNKQNCTIC